MRIGEDPAIGMEPAAYVDTLVARPSLLALFGGRFRSDRCALKTIRSESA